MPEATADDEAAGETEAKTEGSVATAVGFVEAAAPVDDPWASTVTAVLGVGVIVLGFGGLAAAALVRDTVPGLVHLLNDNMMIFAGGALALVAIAGGVAFVLAKRSS